MQIVDALWGPTSRPSPTSENWSGGVSVYWYDKDGHEHRPDNFDDLSQACAQEVVNNIEFSGRIDDGNSCYFVYYLSDARVIVRLGSYDRNFFDNISGLIKRLFPLPMPTEAMLKLEGLLRRFHLIAKQLEKRHLGKQPFTIVDEYDVQDLLHALLYLDFGDIRREDSTPQTSGRSVHPDFLLKEHQVGIEVKYASDNLRDGKLGDELLQDIGRYSAHPDCKTLVCFIYDPGFVVANRVGLQNDLERHSTPGMQVVARIYPP